ncbi:apoptosis-inducing factor 2, partial [Tremellales sp. Uapishka_1]
MSDLKNIVIIGGSCAGLSAANTLVPNLPTTHRILVIDALPFGFWPIAALRAAVVPGWEKRVSVPLTTATVFPAGSEHKVLAPYKVVELKQNSVILDKEFEGSTEVPFFVGPSQPCPKKLSSSTDLATPQKALIATGSLQPSPMRPSADSTAESWQKDLVRIQNDLVKATNVVVIGGGSVGLEVAGEIRAQHPKVKITIVHPETHVMHPAASVDPVKNGVTSYSSPPTLPKLSTALEKALKDIDITTVLGDKVVIAKGDVAEGDWNGSFGIQTGIKTVKLESGKTLEADYVFMSVGNKPNTGLVAKADSAALDNDLVTVDEYLRVKSTNPASILTKNYFAAGDCSNIVGWKNSQTADAYAASAANNIIGEVKSRALKKLAIERKAFMMIPLGPAHGSGSVTLPYVGTFVAPEFMVRKGKGEDLLIQSTFLPRFKGSQKVSVPAA